ncbi:MAG: hypothetical protein HQK84_03615, partial [Nitrospinae bacterium]|nr:hypothetical protein [Nitrospinota bacterium]
MVDQTLKKSHPLSLRISNADIEAIQHKAAKAGVPYQTLIKSILVDPEKLVFQEQTILISFITLILLLR